MLCEDSILININPYDNDEMYSVFKFLEYFLIHKEDMLINNIYICLVNKHKIDIIQLKEKYKQLFNNLFVFNEIEVNDDYLIIFNNTVVDCIDTYNENDYYLELKDMNISYQIILTTEENELINTELFSNNVYLCDKYKKLKKHIHCDSIPALDSFNLSNKDVNNIKNYIEPMYNKIDIQNGVYLICCMECIYEIIRLNFIGYTIDTKDLKIELSNHILKKYFEY